MFFDLWEFFTELGDQQLRIHGSTQLFGCMPIQNCIFFKTALLFSAASEAGELTLSLLNRRHPIFRVLFLQIDVLHCASDIPSSAIVQKYLVCEKK